jgi:hypothetical protein
VVRLSMSVGWWVDALHVVIVIFLGLGWLLPREALPTHILLSFATLSGWCAFGFCWITELSNELHHEKRPGDKFQVLIGIRRSLLSLFACTRQMDGENDPVGVGSIVVASSMSVMRLDKMHGVLLIGFHACWVSVSLILLNLRAKRGAAI